jgi:hypothetical protein
MIDVQDMIELQDMIEVQDMRDWIQACHLQRC